MNQLKLCALVIMVCVIAPLCVAYAWPVGADDLPQYTSENTQNITSDLANSQVDIYTEYNDIYMNNQLLARYAIDDYPNITTPGTWTFNPSDFRLLQSIQYETITSILTSYQFGNMKTWVDNNFPGGVPDDGCAVEIYPAYYYTATVDGERFNYLRYVYESNIIYYLPYGGGSTIKTVSGDKTVEIDGFTNVHDTFEVQWFEYYTVFADLRYGFKVPNYSDDTHPGEWYNGYLNQQVDILLKLSDNNEVGIQVASYGLYFVKNNGGITLQARQGANGYVTIGTMDDYPYCMVRIDTATDKITIAGLLGMRDFTDNYERHIRASVEYDVSMDPFYYLTLVNYNDTDGNAYYFVPKTISATRTAGGINSASMDLCLYLGQSGDGQIDLRTVTKWPTAANGLTIQVNNGAVVGGTISNDGILTFGDYFGPINNTKILLIGDNVYINGEKVISSNSLIHSCKISFNGQWLANVYYSDLATEYTKVYSWIPGGFGLDISGFCMAGLISSSGAGITAALAGRRSGAKVALVVMTAIMCAAVYLVMLMQ